MIITIIKINIVREEEIMILIMYKKKVTIIKNQGLIKIIILVFFKFLIFKEVIYVPKT